MFSSGAFGELLAQLIKHTLGPIVASAASHEMQTLFETQYAMGEILDGDGYRNELAMHANEADYNRALTWASPMAGELRSTNSSRS